jgi:hypothetical protein
MPKLLRPFASAIGLDLIFGAAEAHVAVADRIEVHFGTIEAFLAEVS